MKQQHQSARWLPWVMWGLGALFFFAEYFARVAPSVMVPDLMRTFAVGAFALGSLSAYFYISYLGMQIPVGLLIDRFGVRNLLTASVLICALGCALFGWAQSLWQLNLSRLLIGFGAAFAFVSALKLATIWLPRKHFGLVAGITQALGMLGAAVGDAPMAYTVSQLGWRLTMLVIALIFVVMAALIYIFVRNRPRDQATNIDQHQVPLWLSLKTVLSNRQSWINGTYVALLYASTAAFAEFWGVSFLRNVYALSNETAAFAIGLIFIGWGVGGPLAGWLSDRIGKRKPLMYISSLCGLGLFTILLYVPHISTIGIFIILFLFGLTNTGVVMAYALASEINPHRMAGTSLAFANIASVIVGAVLQPVIGELLDLFWHGHRVNGVPLYTASDYRLALLVLPICLMLSFLFAFFVRETYCRPIE